MLIITLAAAPTGGRLSQQRRDVQVAGGVDVAPAGQGLRDRHELEARLDAQQRDLRCVARRCLEGRRAGGALRVRVAGHLHRRGELPVRRGILVREGEEPVGERQPGLVRPGVQVGVLDVLRATHRQRRHHRHQRGAETGGDRRGAPATRHRRCRAELADERVEAQVAKTGRGDRVHAADCTVAARVR